MTFYEPIFHRCPNTKNNLFRHFLTQKLHLPDVFPKSCFKEKSLPCQVSCETCLGFSVSTACLRFETMEPPLCGEASNSWQKMLSLYQAAQQRLAIASFSQLLQSLTSPWFQEKGHWHEWFFSEVSGNEMDGYGKLMCPLISIAETK